MLRSRLLAACLAATLLAAACADDDATAPEANATDDPAASTDEDQAAATTTTSTTTTTEAPRPAVSAGCEADDPVPPGETRVELSSQERDWWYLRHVPPAHDGRRPVPLVVSFHGYSEGAEVHALHTALGLHGEDHGYVAVFPQGQGEVPRWDTQGGSRDVEYVGDLLDDLEQALCLDLDRIHVTGLSNGAAMASRVACAHADRVASAAPVAGVRGAVSCPRPVPIVSFHGTADEFVPWEGGVGEAAADLPAPDGSGLTLGELEADDDISGRPPIFAQMSAWAMANGCEEEPAEERIAHDVAHLVWDCPDEGAVELYRVDGGGHTWPGSEFSISIEPVVGPTTTSIWATEVMWEFFTRHPMP